MDHLHMSHTEFALIHSIAQRRGVSVESVVQQLLTEAIVTRIARTLTPQRIAQIVPFRRRYDA